MNTAPGPAAPLHLAGPDGPWEPVRDVLESARPVIVHTTWGEWLTAALLDPELRALLGGDWQRYRHTPSAAGRFRFAVSRMVIRHTAAAALQTAPGSLDLTYRPGGRPQLRGLGEELEVSLAHTEDVLVVGVSATGPVGVDVEPLGRPVSFELLRDHVCTPEEAEALAALPEAERALRMLNLWTLKEAYTKALGHGLRRRFSSIAFGRDAQGRTVLADDTPPAWEFATHVVQGRYLASIAHRRHPGVTVSPLPEPGAAAWSPSPSAPQSPDPR
ncbi:4'-phosphopantetheinyl transferase superfamily protein [Streptomyces sp. ITFR-16]|uniref:4'-phosphopantetheinyl transferase family protein n=1 Tax=Streptomyces sp. ITFR-16 TaxID=3075198 RepID=UPI00288ACE16|nr:4'-phosphopantetheinyl transferase superfamily protein [Streptomyces sp. ITFR-16]WNI27246.1 4'-phosphopantetheinyl transferase superfamily protein [Streptomyces sp. ITFR-16]